MHSTEQWKSKIKSNISIQCSATRIAYQIQIRLHLWELDEPIDTHSHTHTSVKESFWLQCNEKRLCARYGVHCAVSQLVVDFNEWNCIQTLSFSKSNAHFLHYHTDQLQTPRLKCYRSCHSMRPHFAFIRQNNNMICICKENACSCMFSFTFHRH